MEKDKAAAVNAGQKSLDTLVADIRALEDEHLAHYRKVAEELELTIKLEDKKQEFKTKQREAIKNLLESTGGNIPELVNKVSEELRRQMRVDTSLAFDAKDHLQFEDSANIYRLPKFPDSFRLDGASDYFGMTVGEQSLLYERIGLFKGIVVDHSKDTPVFQGFRDVVKNEHTAAAPHGGPSNNARSDNGVPADYATRVARIFSRTPFHSGSYDSSYAFSESEARSQEIGITNFGISASFSYSTWGVRVAVQGGYNYGRQRMEQTAVHRKTVHITTNFLLPKIELSFDHMQPCASDEFVAAILKALPDDMPGADAFDRLVYVLKQFGQFVPSSMYVGGRLYATEKKEISETSRIENSVVEHQARMQAAVETWKVDAGIKAEYASEEARKAAEQRKEEAQSLAIRAIGGEGAFVSDSLKWVESLKRFTAWNLIRFDDIIPSLNILPQKLYERCAAVLDAKVKSSRIEDLLAKGCEFLFYNGYYEAFGKKAEPLFFYIQALATGDVLTIDANGLKNELAVSLKGVEGANGQFWWLTPDGKLVNKASYNEREEYVLTLVDATLTITQNNYYEGQFWEVGGGYLKNGKDSKYIFADGAAVKIEATKDQGKKYGFWRFISPGDISQRKTAQKVKASGAPKPLPDTQPDLTEGLFLGSAGSMTSPDDRFELKLVDGRLKILQGDEVFWEPQQFTGIHGLAVLNGTLCTLNEKLGIKDIIHPERGVRLQLQNYGNLELLDINGDVIWESQKIEYGTVRFDDGRVLTIYHDEHGLNLDQQLYAINQPYVGADHQLWYQDRDGRIICKSRRGGTIRLALSYGDGNDPKLELEPLNKLAKRQAWSEVGSSAGPLFSKEGGDSKKYLKIQIGGSRIWASETAPTSCRFIVEQGSGDRSRPLKVVRNDQWLENSADHAAYFEMKGAGKHSFHLDMFTIGTKDEIRGLQLYEYEGRLALRIFRASGDPLESRNPGGDHQRYDNNFKFIDKEPIYTGRHLSKAGLKRKGANRIAFNAHSPEGIEIKNDEWNGQTFISMETSGFVDMGVVMAESSDKVVGIGFRQKGNRLAPYLLVIPG